MCQTITRLSIDQSSLRRSEKSDGVVPSKVIDHSRQRSLSPSSALKGQLVFGPLVTAVFVSCTSSSVL